MCEAHTLMVYVILFELGLLKRDQQCMTGAQGYLATLSTHSGACVRMDNLIVAVCVNT
jgi:hypothetical protein